MQTFGVGVIGAGVMGRRMMTALRKHERFQVAAVWDANPAATKSALQELTGARGASSLEALAADPSVDLVYVASPPALHLQGVVAATAAKRACLCEKPLAHRIDEAQALQRVVAASGLAFAVNFPFARSAAAAVLTERVSRGDLGKILSARLLLRFAQWPRPWQAAAAAWLAGPDEGGFTREVISHFVFLAHRLFGTAAIASVQVHREPGQAETSLRARLEYASTTLEIDAEVSGSVVDHNRFEVTGEHGHAALVDWTRFDDGTTTIDMGPSTQATLDGLAAMLDGRTDHGLASADEALAVTQCVEALLQA